MFCRGKVLYNPRSDRDLEIEFWGEEEVSVWRAKSEKGVFPTGPLPALIVLQLGERPSGSQYNRSPHRRD